jgi:hypothetical protein
MQKPSSQPGGAFAIQSPAFGPVCIMPSPDARKAASTAWVILDLQMFVASTNSTFFSFSL